eukprot:1363445-Rhodomonas_salina.2
MQDSEATLIAGWLCHTKPGACERPGCAVWRLDGSQRDTLCAGICRSCMCVGVGVQSGVGKKGPELARSGGARGRRRPRR